MSRLREIYDGTDKDAIIYGLGATCGVLLIALFALSLNAM